LEIRLFGILIDIIIYNKFNHTLGSGMMDEVKARKEYLKTSVIKRKQKADAIRAEWRRNQFENY
jgi:hypothetical protein